MMSEAGHDALIGSVDAVQADHFMPARLFGSFTDAERTPWHDMATHGKMVLFAGGLGFRYSAKDWSDWAGDPRHGYGSDDYLSNTVMGGRNPMCDGPFSRRTVMTYWLLNDVCTVLARSPFEAHEFGGTVQQQRTTFGGECEVWVNRGSDRIWHVADGMQLPEYGFYAKTPDVTAGIVLLDGRRAAFSKSRDAFFVDARPVHSAAGRTSMESFVKAGRYVGEGVFELDIHINVLEAIPGYRPFVHLCNATVAKDGEHIAFQVPMPIPSHIEDPCIYDITLPIRIPKEMPAGVYAVRYGFFRPSDWRRLGIDGMLDGASRVMGGELHVEKDANGFTQGRFVCETPTADSELNADKKKLDFGGIVTDGAFRLVRDSDTEWRLIPLPGSHAFTATLSLDTLDAGQHSVSAVEMIDPFYTTAQPPEWTQDGDTLTLSCDGRSFAYRIK